MSKSPKLTPFYEISGTVGTGPMGRATVDLNQPFGTSGAAGLNLLYAKGDTPGRDEVNTETWGVAPSVAIGLNGPTRVILSYFYLGDDNLPDYGLPYLRGEPAPVRNANFYGLPNRDYEHDNVNIGTIRLEHDFNENIRLRNTLRLASLDRGSLVSIPAIVGGSFTTLPLSQIQVTRTGTQRAELDQYALNNAEVVAKFDTGPFKHTLVGGVDASYETQEIQRYTFTGVPPTTLVNPFSYPNLSTHEPRQELQREVQRDGGGRLRGRRDGDHRVAQDHGRAPLRHLRRRLRATCSWARSSRGPTRRSARGRPSSSSRPRSRPTTSRTGPSFNPSAEALTLALNNASTEPEKNETYELGAKWDLFDGRRSGRAPPSSRSTRPTRAPPIRRSGVMVTDGQAARARLRDRGGRADPAGAGTSSPATPTSTRGSLDPSTSSRPASRSRASDIPNVPENTGEPVDDVRHHADQWQVGGGAIYSTSASRTTTTSTWCRATCAAT